MSALFSKPKIPKVNPAPQVSVDAIPERTSDQTAALAESQRSRFFKSQGGRASTMLTGGTGTEGGTSAVRFLGGAART